MRAISPRAPPVSGTLVVQLLPAPLFENQSLLIRFSPCQVRVVWAWAVAMKRAQNDIVRAPKRATGAAPLNVRIIGVPPKISSEAVRDSPARREAIAEGSSIGRRVSRTRRRSLLL